MKPPKQEEIYPRHYRDRAELEAHAGEFIDRYYNRRRLHSALDYRSPEAFEQSLLDQPPSVSGPGVSFCRHEGIYLPDGNGQGRERRGPLPRSSVRGVPAGYSSSSCSAADPGSPSPPMLMLQPST